MNICRLGWAGIELESAGHTAVIDPLETMGALAQFTGETRTPLPAPRTGASLALVTHLHRDHTDAAAIARALSPEDGVLLRPAPAAGEILDIGALVPAEQELEQAALSDVRVVEPWQ